MAEGSSWWHWYYFLDHKEVYKSGEKKSENSQEGGEGTKRQKIGGELRHTIHTLKKVAHMSSKDRNVVLRTLKKRASKKKQLASEDGSQSNSDEVASSASVNK